MSHGHKLGLSMDPSTLNALRSQSKDTPDAALRQAAKQFEGVFLNMMLKSMRETVPTDGAFDSEQSKMFTGMLDEQYASQLSEGKGLGLADMIVRQLSQTLKARRTGAAEPLAAAAGVSEASSGSADLAPTTAPFGAAPGAAGPGGAAPGAPGTAGPSIVRRFHAAMRDAAHAASSATGIPADFMVAQAGLESGWGRHQPRTADGQPSHNLFGIKAGTNWHGAVAHAVTTEIVNGAPQQVQQTFRAYASYDDAFQDYAALLSGNARYARALDASNPQAFAGALQKAGYATDPHYAGKVAHAIQLVTGLQA